MKYSVIIPAYNCEATLERTVLSIQKCGLTDYEILLVDDGSKDITPEICDRLETENGNIRVFHQVNGGVSSARNYGLAEAKGEYVWFFDSDDLVDPGSMVHAAQIVEKYAPDMLAFGMSFDYYQKKRLYQRLELYYDFEGELTPEKIDEEFLELYRNNSLTSSCNKLFRRSVLKENNIVYNKELFILEDLFFVLKALEYCRTLYNLPQVIYRYIQATSTDSNHAGKRLSGVESLARYLKPFEDILSRHPDVLTLVFYMLLRQKISIQTVAEMKITAQNNCDNIYTTGKYSKYATDEDKALVFKLENGKWNQLLWARYKSRARKALVGIVKKNSLYCIVKGQNSKRVKW